MSKYEADKKQVEYEDGIPFYAERKQTGFDGFARFRFFDGPDDKTIANEIAIYRKNGWVVKGQGVRRWKEKRAFAIEFRPTASHALAMAWKKLKWDLFGETRIIFWFMLLGVVVGLLALAGGISAVTWLVVKIVHNTH